MTGKRTKEFNRRGGGVTRILAGVCAFALCLGLMMTPLSVSAASAGGAPYSSEMAGVAQTSALQRARAVTRKINYNLPGVSNRSVYAHTQMTTKLNSVTLSDKSLVLNGITYVPLRATAAAAGATVNYSSATRTMTVSMAGLYMTATDGGFVVYANDRPLFNFSPIVVMSNGRMYIPASTFCKAFGLSFVSSGGAVSVSGSVKPLLPAASYYREDEVYWLSKIISAESSGESLLGQIAVGDVILNRVKSSLYPNTIYSVIFDRKYGVQFSPVANGSIYKSPTYTATLAAKICLEGTSLSDNAMYFINPTVAPNSWVSKNRPYAYTIGHHDFYL